MKNKVESDLASATLFFLDKWTFLFGWSGVFDVVLVDEHLVVMVFVDGDDASAEDSSFSFVKTSHGIFSSITDSSFVSKEQKLSADCGWFWSTNVMESDNRLSSLYGREPDQIFLRIRFRSSIWRNTHRLFGLFDRKNAKNTGFHQIYLGLFSFFDTLTPDWKFWLLLLVQSLIEQTATFLLFAVPWHCK